MPLSPERAAPRVLLASDAPDWHSRAMTAALAAVGIDAVRVDLAACGFDTTRASGLSLDHFGHDLPVAALVRTLAAGTFEAVTKRLGVLHALSRLGVLVRNDAQAIERCVDKSMTSFLLAQANVPTPATWALESLEQAGSLVQRLRSAGPLVLKPLFGSQGKGLKLIRGAEDLPTSEAVGGVFYLQRFEAEVQDEYRDFRFFVLRGRVVAGMMRRAASWITNVKQGGAPQRIGREPQLEALAVAAAAAVGAHFAGVDVLIARDGRPTVLEVNSMPAWSGLQKVSDVDLAATIAADIAADVMARIDA